MSAPKKVVLFERKETDKTGETDKVSNQGLLLAVFGDDLDLVRPMLVSFEGNPNKVAGKSWWGQPWVGNAKADPGLPASANNYFSLATFRPDESGKYRRQKSRFHALHAVMLDDVGSKVARDRLSLLPTWLLETSPGNFQAGYVLREPMADGNAADRLMKAIVSAGLCDPGANGPQARLARLPIAINGKHTPPFHCRMADWAPERRYSLQELVDGLGLEINQTRRTSRSCTPKAQAHPDDGEAVWIPRPSENVVLAALRDRGLYKNPLCDSKHDITCPWVDEHTDRADGGTAYFEPNGDWPLGGFNCLHGHCAERHIHDLLRFLDIEAGAARMKPTIRIVAGEIHRVVDAAERELAQSRQHYQRGGQIVTVVTDPGTRETRVEALSLSALVRDLADLAIWQRFDGRTRDWVRTDPPDRPVGVLLNALRYPHLPVLNGLTRQPHLRPDGSLMPVSGYDAATGMFGVFDAGAFSVPDNPTRKEADGALAFLRDLLDEFRFASEMDCAAALAAILTAALRPSLPLAPMFHVRAHTPGSGKSYLCALISAFAAPQPGTPTTFPAFDEECRKQLLAELMRSPAVIEFDNLTGDLVAHKSLCTVLTSESLTGRVLGTSKTVTVGTRALILSSGNNVGPVQDMTRRCISIRLDPGVEVPAARVFKRPNLVRDLFHGRGRYVSAALTIVRAWVVAGRPKSECKALASYGEWSDLCRQPLLWLGCGDAAASAFESMAEDPERAILGRLLNAWSAMFGMVPAMVRDAVRKSREMRKARPEYWEVLQDISDEGSEINGRKIGRWIARRAGRVVNGLRIVRATGNTSSERWRLESVSSVLPVCSDQSEKVAGDADAYLRASSGE